MHQPRPYGLLAVGGELTDEDTAAVEILARRLTNIKQLSGVQSMRMVRSLPDGGYAIAQDIGGTFRVITHKPEPPPEIPFEGIAVDYLPMLFSGVIKKSILREGEGVSMKLTKDTQRRLRNYEQGKKAPAEVELQRFRIPYSQMVQELAPQDPGLMFYTQYEAQRPTWYSGAMAEVMQIVGGYGRQKLKELPDNENERARMQVPEAVMKLIRQQIGDVRLPGYKGLPHEDGEFQYDYKFNNTNGVGFDTDGKPWLLRVTPGAVWAMPLPLIPATTTEAFKDYVTENGDDEIVGILERFGGMPSGERFPTSSTVFGAWKRAGVIIKVCNTSDFYEHISYSSACGWSFNTKGTEGYNTCYDYDEEVGLGYGLAYKMKIKLNAATVDKVPPKEMPEDPADRKKVDSYLASLFKLLPQDGKGLAIKYKLRRVEMDQILARANEKATQEDVDYWDNLELEPIASHSGSVTQVGRGWLYSPGDFEHGPQIKYPEPFEKGCISHDFRPLIEGRWKKQYPQQDTIMFGYYVGDDLRIVRYFYDPRSFNQPEESDFEECMVVGSWTKTVTSGGSALAGHFYTSDIDDRKALAAQTTTTRVIGKDRGYDNPPFFSQDYPFSRPGTIYRNRYFEQTNMVDSTEGHQMDTAICIPYLCRNAVLHARYEITSGSYKSIGNGLEPMPDPTEYRYWTYHKAFAWNGSIEKMVAKPYPEDGSPVWVEMEQHNKYPCSDFADGGPWIQNLPADYTWLVHPDPNVWNMQGGGGPPKFKPIQKIEYGEGKETGGVKVSILNEPGVVFTGRLPQRTYFLGSPEISAGVFYRDACQVVFGDTVYANVSESADEKGTVRKYFGYCALVDHARAHHFIGVINE